MAIKSRGVRFMKHQIILIYSLDYIRLASFLFLNIAATYYFSNSKISSLANKRVNCRKHRTKLEVKLCFFFHWEFLRLNIKFPKSKPNQT